LPAIVHSLRWTIPNSSFFPYQLHPPLLPLSDVMSELAFSVFQDVQFP
jgi:hypothetical protein